MNDFYSLDRLMEFGVGMAMAQQMINMMNQTMQQMQVPGSVQTMPQPTVQPIYVAIDGQQVGPLSESEVLNLVNQKKINKDTLVWIPGMSAWKPMEQVPQALKIIAMAPPPLPI